MNEDWKYWKDQSESWQREFEHMVRIRDRYVAELDAASALIAQMLKALEVIAARFTDGNGYHDNCGIGDSGFTWGQVRAAIRKAKGE